jgi:hypothetical protein
VIWSKEFPLGQGARHLRRQFTASNKPRTVPTRYHSCSAVLAVLLCLLATRALAQTTLTGRALDGATQEGLPFANVVLKAADPAGKIVQAAVADEQGRFRFPSVKAGRYQLQVLQLGFTTLTRPVEVAAGSPASTWVPSRCCPLPRAWAK